MTAFLAFRPIAAQQGAVTGKVTDRVTGQAVGQAQVSIVGTPLGQLTNDQGQFTIRGISPGPVTLRALRVGYAEARATAAVTAGSTATVDIAMSSVAINLAPVVTTATGEQRRLEVGNSVAQIDAAKLTQERPISNMADMLVAKAAGVQVLPGNSTGTGARVRIRGTNSLSLSNDPVYIVDGVRIESSTNSSSISVGGSIQSRVNDLNPEEIESIEIVKGPSAATLYGTDAANGVVVIKTKRGRAGAPQWSTFVENGTITDLNTYPTAYTNVGTLQPSGTATSSCYLTRIASGACKSDSLRAFNLFDDKTTTPLGLGRRQSYGAQVTGGSDRATYFVSGTWEDEYGVNKIPQFDVQRLQADGTTILPQWKHPNALSKASGRANLNLVLSQDAEVAISTGIISSTQRLPQTDNNTTGLLSSAYGGPGYKANGNSSLGNPLMGYRRFTPGDVFQETVGQDINRVITSANPTWRPASWLSTRANVGFDFTNRVDTDLCRFDTCSDFGTSRLGFKTDNRTTFFQYTVDGAATATFQPTPTVNTKSTAGVQYFRNYFNRNGAASLELPPGATTVTAGSIQTAEERSTETRTLGAFVQQELAWRDRVFITGAVRSDRNSAFGADFKTVFYPKASLSWVVSDESFFPKVSWMNQLRLRSAWGESGVQPGTTDAVRFDSTTLARIDGADHTGITFQSLGNNKLKPETTREIEAGIDGQFLGNRLNVELTYYNKRSRDALVQRILPPSVGTGQESRFENISQVSNKGFEALVTAQLLQRKAFGWDVSVNASTNTNRLDKLGDVPQIVLGILNRDVEGYPINAYWGQAIKSYKDADGNGLITANEIVVDTATTFLGYSIPRTELALTNGFDLFNHRIRITALADYKGGFKLDNDTERIRCQNRLNCSGLMNPQASLFEQARVVALREDPTRTQSGFVEDASFVRLREVAVTFYAPDRWAHLVRGSRLSATLSGRNLHKWTKYTGIDPESNYGQFDIPNDFQTAPPPSYFVFRLNLGL